MHMSSGEDYLKVGDLGAHELAEPGLPHTGAALARLWKPQVQPTRGLRSQDQGWNAL